VTRRASGSAPTLSAGATALIAFALLCALPLAAGCTSADEAAREHLATAATHFEAYRASDSHIATELARVDGLLESADATEGAEGAEVVVVVRKELTSQRADVEAARTELVAVTESGASEVLVEYAELQLQLADTLLELDGAMVAYVSALESLHAPPPGGERSREEADALVAEVTAAREAFGPLREEYDERSAGVLRHFEEHGLGVDM
jgi:hypothetical protein